jgi:Uncharacterized protein conserved in bacteria
MKKIIIPLCIVLSSHFANGQRSAQFESTDRLFIEGKEMFNLKNYTGCIDKIQAYKANTQNKDFIHEADFLLAASAFEQGLPEAENLLQKFIATYPDTNHSPDVYFMLASICFGQGDYMLAIAAFESSDIDLLSPGKQEAYSFRLAYSLLQTGERNKSRSYFSRIQQIGKTYKTASAYYIAYIDYADGKYDESLIAFSKLKENKEFTEQSQFYITQIYFIQNKYERVVREGENLLSSYPNNENKAEVNRIIGNSYFNLGDQSSAIKYLSRYVSQTDAPLRGDLYLLGISYYNEGDYNNAKSMLGRTITQNDVLTQNAYLYLGQTALKLNDKNNARMAFEAAATAKFDSQVREVALYNYALLLHETSFSGFGESVTIFEDFLNDYPDSQYSDRVNDYIVEVYLTTKNYEAALTSINKIKRPSTKIQEAKQNILFQLGTQSFANNNIDEAIMFFDEAISLGGYDREARDNAYFWRGESFFRKNNYDRAISDYRAYISNSNQRGSETYALAHYGLGYCFFNKQQYSEALYNFRQYAELGRNSTTAAYSDAYNRIGDCLFYNRQFTAAEEAYSYAAKILPSSGDYAIYQRGFILGLQKNYTGKINEMDRLIREFPESQYIDDAMFEKGRAYVMLGDRENAIRTFNNLISNYQQTSLARKAGVQLGLLYYDSNQLEKAAEEYKKVIKNYPGSEEAKVAMQDLRTIYIDMNDVGGYAAFANSLGTGMALEINEQDSLTYIAAERLFMRGDNEGALRSMQRYLSDYPNGAFNANANYYLGSISFSRKEYDKALTFFEKVLNSGDVKFREEAFARVAEIEYLNKDYSSALETFRSLAVIAENPDNKRAAQLGIMRCAQFTNNYDEAIKAATALLSDSRLSPEIAIEARHLRVKAYLSTKQENKALPDLIALGQDTRTVHGAEAKYLLAQYYFDTKDNKKAEEVLMDFMEKGTPHQYWLARGFILLADIYISQEDDFQARQYLTSLQNNYKGNDDIAGMIENRLGKLKN